ncbi:MAG: ACP S-malonyltransferase [Chloroflexi bacterium]|nr:ACP S-malonyltransferase [Chloroflexota bacterium]
MVFFQDLPLDANTAVVFPGQGSQRPGMGRAFAAASQAAAAVFAEADAALGLPLSRLCWEGPEDELRQTVNAQPALLTCGIAGLHWAIEQGLLPGRPAFVAGHSLGEYTALVAAGSLRFEDAIRLVRERGRLMQEASTAIPSGMAAVIGADPGTVEVACRTAAADTRQPVQPANLNAPGQIVISGAHAALARAVELLKSGGVRRIVPLNVSGAFHSAVMEPAAGGLQHALRVSAFADAAVPVVVNTTAQPLQSAAALREALVAQLCAPVRWQQSVETMAAAGVDTFFEVGAGEVLSGLMRRINPNLKAVALGG